jgi:hypothetical protein
MHLSWAVSSSLIQLGANSTIPRRKVRCVCARVRQIGLIRVLTAESPARPSFWKRLTMRKSSGAEKKDAQEKKKTGTLRGLFKRKDSTK